MELGTDRPQAIVSYLGRCVSMPFPLENEKDPLYVPASSFARALTLSLSLPLLPVSFAESRFSLLWRITVAILSRPASNSIYNWAKTTDTLVPLRLASSLSVRLRTGH